MTNVQIEAGTLTANRADRIVSGLLLPFGEVGNTNLGKFSVPENRVAIPQDVTVLAANTDHDRENPVARFMTAVATKAGIVATFSIGKNPEGDALLAEIERTDDPTARKKLSAEIKNVVIRNGQLVAGALFGAAFVKQGAFPSATVLAADVGDPDAYESHSEDTYTDENGVTWTRVYDTKSETTVEDDGNTKTETTTTTTVVEETAEPGQPADPEEDSAVGVPNTLTAAKGAATTEPRLPGLATIYAAIADLRTNPDAADARTVLAALADIKISGSGALPGAGVLRENWVGQVWQGKTYERKYINLSKLGTDISAQGKKGFKIARGTTGSPVDHLGGDWAGNKTDVPTGVGNTTTIASTLARFAWAADFAREFFDLPGGQEVVEAFVRLVVEDYASWSDGKALSTYVTTAGAPVAPGTYPTQYSKALGLLLQGILAVQRAKDTPTYAIVNQTAMEQLVYTPFELIPQFVNFDFTTELSGTADGGKVQVVEAPDSAFTGIKANEPAVIVGAKNAIEFDELGSTPLTIDALEIAKGGVDRAVHGYLQTFIVRPESLILVGTAAA
ncbi:hypothetical protein [Leifsonia aquatica]|uniref:hypothetical protein n=1 Tax=Leifsonia aquatica TaxID=144185 RepID=UPI00381803D0